MMILRDKTAVVTGAANGLGRALAIELHRQGCHLALIDRDGEALAALLGALGRAGPRVTTHCLDVSDEQAVAQARSDILAAHTGVDLLINNAGISISRRFAEMEPDDFSRVMAVNFWGAVHCTRHFLPDLRSRPGSRLANITSDFALLGFPGKTAYGASKGALSSFTLSLQTEFGDRSPAVCLVIPPPMDTGLVRNNPHSSAAAHALEVDFLHRHGMPLPRAAACIVRGIRRGRRRMVIGAMMYWIDLCSRLFPSALGWWIGRNRALQMFA